MGVERKDAEELLAALDPQQQEVALQVSGPLCVRAGAGTGKTRAITYRIAYGARSGAIDPRTVLAVTFTTKAAAEMRARLKTLGVPGVQARTFHSAALRQLRYFWGRSFGGDCPEIVSHKGSLVAAAAARCALTVDRTVVRDIAAEIEWAKVSMLGVEDYGDASAQSGRVLPGTLSLDEFERVYAAYEEAKMQRRVIDFEDVLALMCATLQKNEDVCGAVRRQYQSFVVDEYQDVSALQQKLLDLWRGDRRDICVVGDVAQTIYSFAGANPKFLTDFHLRFPEGRVVELNRDYRSTPQVVAVANQVISRARGADGIGPERGLPGAVRLKSQRELGPAVQFVDYSDDDAQAEGVAERIAELQKQGHSAGQIAILYRTNAQSEAFEKALAQRGISFQVHGGKRFFERVEVRQAVVQLRRMQKTSELVGAGDQLPLVEAVQDVVAQLGWSEEPPAGTGAVRDRFENLDALVTMAKERPDDTLSQFVAELQERAEAQAAPVINGVTLSTLHAAKGLEWEAVFLAGVSEGLLPISLAEAPAAIEEERRLLYVGVTRARDFLQLSWAHSRSGGRSQRRKVSRFLEAIWPQESLREQSRRATLSRAAKSGQDKARFENEADPETLALFEQLRRWRLDIARAMSVPAFTVMPDVTLRDIATAKPKTLKQLGVLRGIGEARMEKFGADILRVIREAS